MNVYYWSKQRNLGMWPLVLLSMLESWIVGKSTILVHLDDSNYVEIVHWFNK